VSVTTFKGIKYVDIREYYTDKSSGEEKPGKKGISLTIDQWNKLKAAVSTTIVDADTMSRFKNINF
jgi:hypothetical protein